MNSDPMGYYYLSNAKVRNIIGLIMTITTYISVYAIALAIKSACWYFASLLWSIPIVGPVIVALGGFYFSMQAGNIAEALFKAYKRRKGLDITVG